jgi:hypothetical protein
MSTTQWNCFEIPVSVKSLTCDIPQLNQGLRSGIRGRIIWLHIKGDPIKYNLQPVRTLFEKGPLQYNYRTWIKNARQQEHRLLHLNSTDTYDPTYLWLCKLRPLGLEWTAVVRLVGDLTRREVFCLTGSRNYSNIFDKKVWRAWAHKTHRRRRMRLSR